LFEHCPYSFGIFPSLGIGHWGGVTLEFGLSWSVPAGGRVTGPKMLSFPGGRVWRNILSDRCHVLCQQKPCIETIVDRTSSRPVFAVRTLVLEILHFTYHRKPRIVRAWHFSLRSWVNNKFRTDHRRIGSVNFI